MSRVTRTGFLRVAALAAGLGFTGLVPVRAEAENLADALVGAYNTSGLLEQNRALLRATDENVAIAMAALRPILAWSASATRSFNQSQTIGLRSSTQTSTYGVGLTAQFLLYDGGSAAVGILRAKESVLGTRQALLSVEQSVLFRAISAYLNVNGQSQNVTLRENNLRLLREELKASKDRFEVGEVTRTDVALAESSVAQAISELAIARGALTNSKAEYAAAVGHTPTQLAAEPTLPARPASISVAQTLAVQNHPDILSAQHQVVVAEMAITELKRALRPTVSLNAAVGLTENFGLSDYQNNASVGLNLSQTIYQGGALSARIRAAIAQRDVSRGNLLVVQRNVVQDATTAFVRLEVSLESLVATTERIRASEIAFRGVREEATLGARTTLDVLTAEQDLLNAHTARISAEVERSTAAYQLLQAQGLLTAERLRLAVQIYDPTIYYNLAKNAPVPMSRQGKDLDRVLKSLGKK
ncbi:MAG: TolC family outer membrane protein [Rhodobacteraceae bacterium]|nr:TolC family outer membrane protein [Paracoccaceae bacterium]